MKNDLIMPAYIIVLGTTYSGSGAVYDYLSGRGDLHDPLKGVEYQLPHMPNGLMTIEAIAEKSFHPPTADFVLSQFQIIIDKLSKTPTIYRYGKNYEKMLPSFKIETRKFIEDITSAKLPMNLHWRQLMKSDSNVGYFVSKLKHFLRLREPTPITRILVSQEKFIKAAQNFHDRIFLKDAEDRPVLINQGGSGWNPHESTKYYNNCKTILINRDPRDQFFEIKKYKKASSVNDFIDWYIEMQRRIKSINTSEILKLQFEDFVFQNKKMINVLCKHLSINKNTYSNYNADFSRENIGKYKKFLTNQEIEKIEKSLSEYIFIK